MREVNATQALNGADAHVRFLRPDADIDAEARGARKACETVPATIKKPTKTMPATEPLTGGA